MPAALVPTVRQAISAFVCADDQRPIASRLLCSFIANGRVEMAHGCVEGHGVSPAVIWPLAPQPVRPGPLYTLLHITSPFMPISFNNLIPFYRPFSPQKPLLHRPTRKKKGLRW